MKFKSVEEMTEKLYKRTLWDNIEYYGFWCWWNWLDMLPRRIYWFFQRGKNGFADNDTWDFDTYLTEVIIGGLKQLKKYGHSKYPTQEEFDFMIQGFEDYLNLMDLNFKYNSEAYKLAENNFKQAMKLFTKRYSCLWD